MGFFNRLKNTLKTNKKIPPFPTLQKIFVNSIAQLQLILIGWFAAGFITFSFFLRIIVKCDQEKKNNDRRYSTTNSIAAIFNTQ
jgi:hypothetical protein